jgi:hypothetical protein
MTESHTAASSVKVVAVGLDDDQGETEERPMPAPSATRSNVMATAVRAPPMIAAHETAEGEPGRVLAKRRRMVLAQGRQTDAGTKLGRVRRPYISLKGIATAKRPRP